MVIIGMHDIGIRISYQDADIVGDRNSDHIALTKGQAFVGQAILHSPASAVSNWACSPPSTCPPAVLKH